MPQKKHTFDSLDRLTTLTVVGSDILILEYYFDSVLSIVIWSDEWAIGRPRFWKNARKRLSYWIDRVLPDGQSLAELLISFMDD